MTANNDIDQTYVLPWPLIANLACKALIARRTLDQQIEFGIQEGMIKHEELRSRYIAMKKANRGNFTE